MVDSIPVVHQSETCDYTKTPNEYIMAYNTLYKASEGFGTGNDINIEEYYTNSTFLSL